MNISLDKRGRVILIIALSLIFLGFSVVQAIGSTIVEVSDSGSTLYEPIIAKNPVIIPDPSSGACLVTFIPLTMKNSRTGEGEPGEIPYPLPEPPCFPYPGPGQ